MTAMSDEARSRPLHYLWVLVVAVLVGAAGGYVVGGSAGATQTSTSSLLVVGAFVDDGADLALASNQYVTQRMPTYPEIAVSDLVTGPATAELGAAPDGLDGAITATAAENATVIQLEVTGSDPAEAQRRNQAVTTALQQAIEQTENVPPQPPRVAISVVSQPSLPGEPALGAGAGALIGVVVGAAAGVAMMFQLARRARLRRFRRESVLGPGSGRGTEPAGRAPDDPPATAPGTNGGRVDSPTTQISTRSEAGPGPR